MSLPLSLPSVYPRVCGGTRCYPVISCYGRGLSPRVRGNRNNGSIPACAGEPVEHHPSLLGLSPRVRGNQLNDITIRPQRRSIPACAGEPLPSPERCTRCRVYPRVCGGTTTTGIRPALNVGLSPRVRGNRELGESSLATSRSIPACAGEPLLRTVCCLLVQVYPRVCGGTRLPESPSRTAP